MTATVGSYNFGRGEGFGYFLLETRAGFGRFCYRSRLFPPDTFFSVV